MIEFIKREYKYLLVLVILFAINALLFWLRQGSLVVDTGREFYIPWQMLKGELLYKDIFNIYGPLAYQINALAYIFLGLKITSLVFLGFLNSFVITVTFYLLAREFLDKKFSFLMVLIIMYGAIFTTGLFNYNVPYSFAMPYSFSSLLLSLLFLVKYAKNQNDKFLYFSSLFCGISIANKYDYFFMPFLILGFLLLNKSFSIKKIGFSLLCLLCVPLLSFGFLFLQGVHCSDVFNALVQNYKISSCSSLHFFYQRYAGAYFHPIVFMNVVKSFFPLVIMFFGIVFLLKNLELTANCKLKRFLEIFLFIASAVIFFLFVNIESLGFLPIFATFLFIVFFKDIIKDKSLLILSLVAIFSSLKTYFAMSAVLYGAYAFPLLIIFITVVFASNKFSLLKNDKINTLMKKTTEIILVCLIITFAFSSLYSRSYINSELNTPSGKIYGNRVYVGVYKELIKYVLEHTHPTDKIIVWPETPFLNFLIQRDSDNYYYNLIPLYVELFGERKVIDQLISTKPEYIILNNRDSSDYGYRFICRDYAFNVCKYVNKHYAFDKMIGDSVYNMQIYKRKDLK